MNKAVTLLVFILLFLSGCSFHQKPYITYKNETPLPETSVFITMGFSGNTRGAIFSVNAEETSCYQAGCPAWVRVLPGKNTFKIHFNIYNNGVVSYLNGETTIVIEDMKPKHVYEVDMIPSADYKTFTTKINDLGEDPDVGVFVGLEGVNQKYYRVQFQ